MKILKKYIKIIKNKKNQKNVKFLKINKNNLKKTIQTTLKKKTHYKLKKKWKNWRNFRNYFLSTKKIQFYTRLKWRYNNMRILWHQLSKTYLPNIKNLVFKTQKLGETKFIHFIKKIELRLPILILRARFCHKLINSYNAIKFHLILVNGIIVNRIWYSVNILDIFQKRRHIRLMKVVNTAKDYRKTRFKWRKYRWNQARFILWKVRRVSHFNLYWSKKRNTTLNYLEINYKVPAAIVIKQPFLKELYINRHKKTLTNNILKKVFFLY